MENLGTKSQRGVVRLLVILVAALIVIPAGGLFAFSLFGNGETDSLDTSSSLQTSDRQWYTVERRSFDLTVTATGNLQASEQVEIRAQVEGKDNTIIEIVDEGKNVEAGDVLLRIGSDQIRDDIETEELAVAEARAEKTAADKAFAISQTKAVSDKKAATVTVELAELELEQWKNGDLVQSRQSNELELEKAIRNLERAKENYENSQRLFEDQFISKNDLTTDELAYLDAEAALQTAKLNKEVFETYEYPKLLKKYTSDVDQAKTALETTVAENDRELEQAQSEVVEETRSLQLREQRLADLKRQFENCTIKAPKAGMVVYASSLPGRDWRDDNSLGQGSSVYFNQLIMVLPNREKMIASLLVHEAMIPLVAPGQSVSVRVDALSDRPLTGTVSSVGVMAEDGGWWNRDLRQYRVAVELDQTEAKSVLKPSMRCLGVIRIGRVDNALTVPVQAVHAERRTKFVYVPNGNGTVRKQTVMIGRASETFVEIKDGIDEGQRVLLRDPRPGELVAPKQSKGEQPSSGKDRSAPEDDRQRSDAKQ